MPNYSCEKCGKDFYQKNDYTKHMNRKLPCDGTNMSEKVANLEKKIEKLEKTVPVIEYCKNENLEDGNITERISTMSTTEHKAESNIKTFCAKKCINFNKKVTKDILQKICDKFQLDYNKDSTIKSPYVILLSVYFKEHPSKLTVELLAEFGVKPTVNKPVKKIKDVKKATPKSEKKETKDETKDEKDIDYSYLRLPKNKLIFEMKNSDLEKEKINKQNSDIIISVVKSCHQELFQSLAMDAHICRNDILTIILLKLLEPILSTKPEAGKIDLLNPDYPNYKPSDVKHLEYLKLTKLITDTDNLRSTKGIDNIKRIGGILKSHGYTKNLFENENIISCSDKDILKSIIKKINDIDINVFYNTNDIMGYIAEYFNGYLGKAKEFQTHLTPRCILKSEMLFNHDILIKKLEKCKKAGKKFIVGDYCMGTAGWLITFITHFKNYSDIIELGGGEIQPDMYRYSLINILTTTKRMPKYIQKGNSLCMIDNDYKYQAQFENPPFSSKLKLEMTKNQYINNLTISDEAELELKKKHFDNVYGLKQNNAIVNFLEVKNITLEDGGYCSIVVGYGALFSKPGLKSVREHFMKIYDIKSITVFPRGIFKYTDSATCKITFVKGAPTKEIQMLKTNIDCSEISLVTTVKIEDINKQPNKSWMVDDYLLEPTLNNDIEYIEFGKIFTLEKGILASGKVINDKTGEGMFITGAKVWKHINIEHCTLYGHNLFISTNGNGDNIPIKYYNGHCTFSNLMSVCKINKEYSDRINLKFVYYYLKNKQSYIEEKYQTGQNQQSLDVENFNRFAIPVPSMKKQNQISLDLDECMLFNDNLKNINDGLNKMINKYMANQIRYMEIDNVEKKELKELCNYDIGGTPSRNNMEYWNGTNKWVSIREMCNNVIYNTKEYITDLGVSKSSVTLFSVGTILMSFKLSIGKMAIAGVPLYTNEAIVGINSIDTNQIINKYIYYLLMNTTYKGSNSLIGVGMNKQTLGIIKILVPSIEKQNEIVEYCDYLMNAIKTNKDIYTKNKELIIDILKL
jgi:restriction endonuclease S subunit